MAISGADQTSPEPAKAPRPVGTVNLRSLAPSYEESHHSGYVRHLEVAITEKKNRNIALTGRYGSGKSSILDEFERKHREKTVRISINTLGPDGDEESLTNRIQKELVKQLIYRAEPGQLRSSRFARVEPLTKARAFVEALGLTALVGGLLWLVGVRFDVAGLDDTNDTPVRWASGIGFAALVLLAAWLVRWVIGDRIVSQVSTAGTTVTLESGPDTYFDKYLDEIVAFFDAVEPKFVIFEDLDRFDDPQIFDSLRELNTLINDSAKWKAQDQPLRFIYAIKDSLFEQLGAKPKDDESGEDGTDESADDEVEARQPAVISDEVVDPAVAAVQRANRTKFFELVIPVVPFISHRNARDLLIGALRDLKFPDDAVPRPLLDLVASHATDMRLLLNICNEFVVFSERLLWVDNKAPGMNSGDLFALVAYKNFHLADFEAVPQRLSTLDTLEKHHRDLVRASIQDLERQRRELVRAAAPSRIRTQTANRIGHLLVAFAKASHTTHPDWPRTYGTSSNNHDESQVVTPEFWELVAQEGALTITAQRQGYNPIAVANFTREALEATFPDGMRAATWARLDQAEHRAKIQHLDASIAFLRGANYDSLAKRTEFTSGGKKFAQRVDETLRSELARDLVRRGYINRNYAEYSATFYGEFLGVDVAFFYNHSVQPNQMYVDHQFTNDQSIANLLEQVPSDFTSSVSAFNIQLVSYLVRHEEAEAREVAAFLIADFNADAQTFLDAFLNASDAPREGFIRLLAEQPWSALFDHIAGNDGIPDDETRFSLFDSALLHAQAPTRYTLSDTARTFLTERFETFAAVTAAQPKDRDAITFEFAKRVDLSVADLEAVSKGLRGLIVDAKNYELTAANMRAALGTTGPVSLDHVRKKARVWEYCRDNIDTYLATVRADGKTESSIETPQTLADVLHDQETIWTDQQLVATLELCATAATLPDIDKAPASTWPNLLASGLVAPNVHNLNSYVGEHGTDEHLARFLVPNPGRPVTIEVEEDFDDTTRGALATRILNTDPKLLRPKDRVELAVQLKLPPGTLDPTDITPAQDDLLARAIKANLLPDDEASFLHFITAGWKAVERAFAVSTEAPTFIGPELLSGHEAAFLNSSQVPETLRAKVLEELNLYVADTDAEALKAAGKFAHAKRVKLPLTEVRRIASATQDPNLVLPQLVWTSPTADELIETLVLLGSPYNALRNGPDSEFDLPAGSSAQTLFTRLEEAGKLAIVKKTLSRGRKVRMLV